MRSREVGLRAEEFKLAFPELLMPVVREFFNQRVFARHHPREVERDLCLDPPRRRVLRQVHNFGGIEQSFGRHAAAQNAKPADFLPAFNHHCAQASAGRTAGRRVTGASAADNRDFIVKRIVRTFHSTRKAPSVVSSRI